MTRPLVVLLALLIPLLASCGGERTFDAQELVDALADEGAELNLGENLPSTQDDVEVFEVSFANAAGPGSLVVAEDADSAGAEFQRCEAAITLACFRAANVVLYFDGDPTEAHIAGVGVAIRALASD